MRLGACFSPVISLEAAHCPVAPNPWARSRNGAHPWKLLTSPGLTTVGVPDDHKCEASRVTQCNTIFKAVQKNAFASSRAGFVMYCRAAPAVVPPAATSSPVCFSASLPTSPNLARCRPKSSLEIQNEFSGRCKPAERPRRRLKMAHSGGPTGSSAC